jgi:hypothetical protein
MWFDKWAGHINPGLQQSLGWIFFFAAVILASLIAKLLAPLMPSYPGSCDDTSKLARAIALSRPIPADSPNAWTRDSVWQVTQAMIADAFKLDPRSIHAESRLKDLGGF